MPELPDITVYVERLSVLIGGRTLEQIRIINPFVLRSVDPPADTFAGRSVEKIHRLGKRIVLECPDELYVVMHLMKAGRLHWTPGGPGASPRRRSSLATLNFAHGTLTLTEAGRHRRASLHLVRGRDHLRADHDRGGLEVFEADAAAFRAALQRENRTLKRALTNPRTFSGIGNAYSDEILHAALLSPVQLTHNLNDGEIDRLWASARSVLTAWTDRLRDEVGDGLPEKVTAFHPQMAVHGRYRQPCPRCGAPVQRIVYRSRETNYCAPCQTGGRLLADRALSRLLRADWPRTLEEWEDGERQRVRGGTA